jgi:hypothetical protein
VAVPTPTGQRLFRTHAPKVHLHQMHQDQVVTPSTPESANGLQDKDTKVECCGTSLAHRGARVVLYSIEHARLPTE